MTPLEHLARAVHTNTGQIHGLFLTVQALVKTHPDPAVLSQALEDAAQAGLSHLEMLPTKEDTLIEGFQFVMAGMKGCLPAMPEDAR